MIKQNGPQSSDLCFTEKAGSFFYSCKIISVFFNKEFDFLGPTHILSKKQYFLNKGLVSLCTSAVLTDT